MKPLTDEDLALIGQRVKVLVATPTDARRLLAEVQWLRSAMHDRDVLILRSERALKTLTEVLRDHGLTDTRIELADLVHGEIARHLAAKGDRDT